MSPTRQDLVTTLTRHCVAYMIQVCMFKVKVTVNGPVENLLPKRNLLILRPIIQITKHKKTMCHIQDPGSYVQGQGHTLRSN